MSHPLPPAAVLVAHRVADFSAWKHVFDNTRQFRIDAAIVGHDLGRSADDPSKIYVYGPAGDVDKLKAHMESAELKEIMQNAGVKGRPDVWLMKPVSVDVVSGALPGMIVVHDVEDYATWRKAYDDFNPNLAPAGIVGHAVNQGLDNPNQVIVYHQAKEMAKLRAFTELPELREGMQRAGVVGTPEFHFFKPLESQRY